MKYLKRFYNAIVYIVFHFVYIAILPVQMPIYILTGKEAIYPVIVKLHMKLYIKNI